MYNKKCLECFCCSGRPPKRIPSEYSRLIRQCFRETASGRQHITVPDPQKKQQLGRIISIMKKPAKEHTGKYKLVKYGDPVSYIIEAGRRYPLLRRSLHSARSRLSHRAGKRKQSENLHGSFGFRCHRTVREKHLRNMLPEVLFFSRNASAPVR